MRKIDGQARTIRDVLSGKRYSIDYYQREYRWHRKQVAELLEDLSEQFLDSYDESHERKMVAQYGHYFLGSIILSQKGCRCQERLPVPDTGNSPAGYGRYGRRFQSQPAQAERWTGTT